jgi:hypothetical protein
LFSSEKLLIYPNAHELTILMYWNDDSQQRLDECKRVYHFVKRGTRYLGFHIQRLDPSTLLQAFQLDKNHAQSSCCGQISWFTDMRCDIGALDRVMDAGSKMEKLILQDVGKEALIDEAYNSWVGDDLVDRPNGVLGNISEKLVSDTLGLQEMERQLKLFDKVHALFPSISFH